MEIPPEMVEPPEAMADAAVLLVLPRTHRPRLTPASRTARAGTGGLVAIPRPGR